MCEQRGQVVPLLALLMVAACGLVLVLGRMAGDAVDRARAQAAADAAALAGAAGGRAEAESVAAANGARLLRWEAAGADVRVVVIRRRFEATARARRAGGGRLGPWPAPAGVARAGTGDGTLRAGDPPD
jgi:hypothetical protein